MRLSLFTDYGFRLLIHVAARDPELVTISGVADAYAIPRNHLTKIAHELGRAGYLENVRGRNGGMRLGRPANEINIGALMRLGESSAPLVECFNQESNRCAITPACTLKHMLADACDAFYAALDRYTLADCVVRPNEILRLLEKN